jgi:hypothetical protein
MVLIHMVLIHTVLIHTVLIHTVLIHTVLIHMVLIHMVLIHMVLIHTVLIHMVLIHMVLIHMVLIHTVLIHHHHHISVMELGHLLTRSGLTHPEVSSKVCHDSFCQLENSVGSNSTQQTFCLKYLKSNLSKTEDEIFTLLGCYKA